MLCDFWEDGSRGISGVGHRHLQILLLWILFNVSQGYMQESCLKGGSEDAGLRQLCQVLTMLHSVTYLALWNSIFIHKDKDVAIHLKVIMKIKQWVLPARVL